MLEGRSLHAQGSRRIYSQRCLSAQAPRWHASRRCRQTSRAPRPRPQDWHSVVARAAQGDEVPDAGEEKIAELSQARHVITVDDWNPELVNTLRGVFDERFADPRRIHAERFMWDYWWCPDAEGNVQYNLVRTQAQVYFSPQQHEALVDALLAYGEANLGCRAITPIWVSYYTDGMMQELHSDDPHGPFAFVLSLTRWDSREFTGGETAILRPDTVNLWHRTPQGNTGREFRDLVQLVPAHYGRLTVFDPRFPHGVREVRGTRDPRKGRLVLHGWFTDPSPFITGGLRPEQCTEALNEALEGALSTLSEGADDPDGPTPGSHPCTGVLALRVCVEGKTGTVKQVTFLADTLIPVPSVGVDPSAVRAEVQEELHAWLMDSRYPPSDDGTDTHITLPVVFE